MQLTIGIDVSKDRLDANRLSDRQHIQVTQDRSGRRGHAGEDGRRSGTGAAHATRQDPARAQGVTGSPPALIKDRTAARTRLATATLSLVKRQLNARIRQLEAQLRTIDAAMADAVAQNAAMSHKLAILVSIPGIAETTALSMLIEMPELGTLEGKQAASLAGLASISRQSGKWQGRERIQGGRTVLRRAIHMPALVAARFNPDLKAKYDQLIRAGKPAKLAITAVMRKLVVIANALLRDDRKWSEVRP